MDHGVCVVTHAGFAARATSVMLAGRRVPVLEPVDCALSTMSHLRAMGSWTVAAREVAPSRFELDPEQVAIVARELGIDVSAKRVFRAWADAGYRSIGPGGFHDTLHARQMLTTSVSPLVPWNPRKGYVDSYDLMHNG